MGASSSSSASNDLTRPTDLFLCVEYPGFVESIPRALEKFKGEQHVRQLLLPSAPVSSGPAHEGSLRMWYRPEDTNSYPLYGDVERDLHLHAHQSVSAGGRADRLGTAAAAAAATASTPGAAMATPTPHAHTATGTSEPYYNFLLKVSRRSRKSRRNQAAGSSDAAAVAMSDGEHKDASSNAPSISARLLGMISTSVTFPGLCDYQLLQNPPPLLAGDHSLLTASAAASTAATAATVSAEAHQAASGAHVGATASAPAAEDALKPAQPVVPVSLQSGSGVPCDPYADMPPLFMTRFDYARPYAFANHENDNATVTRLQASAAAARHKATTEEGALAAPGAAVAGTATPSRGKTAPASGSKSKLSSYFTSSVSKAKTAPSSASKKAAAASASAVRAAGAAAGGAGELHLDFPAAADEPDGEEDDGEHAALKTPFKKKQPRSASASAAAAGTGDDEDAGPEHDDIGGVKQPRMQRRHYVKYEDRKRHT